MGWPRSQAAVVVFAIVCSLSPSAAQPPSPCGDNSMPKCSDGSNPGSPPSCPDNQTPKCADGSEPSPPGGGTGGGGGGGGGDTTGGGTTGGGGGGGGGGGNGTPQSSSPHAASMLGNVGTTTVGGTVPETNTQLPVGEDIYGPFEAGFGAQQENIITALGCSTPSQAYVSGGIDTKTAELHMATGCGIVLPRWENGQYVSLLDTCGGHTREYHFHERLSCLYSNNTGGHSAKVGETTEATGRQSIYGKWEHDTDEELPLLDACGGHWGRTPESTSQDVYHYHIQDEAPFTIGCIGPNDDNTMVKVQQCRDFYTGCDGVFESLTTPAGTIQYDNWCPCYDAMGSNTGVNIKELLYFRVVTGALTVTVDSSVDKCTNTFKNNVKDSLAAGASAVSSATYTAADIVNVKVSGCSNRRLSGSASLRRLAQVDISYQIKAEDSSAAATLASASSTNEAGFVSSFTTTMGNNGVTVSSPQLTANTMPPTSAPGTTTEPGTTSEMAATTTMDDATSETTQASQGTQDPVAANTAKSQRAWLGLLGFAVFVAANTH